MIRECRGGPYVPARIHHTERDGWWATVNGQRCGAAAPEPFRADGVVRIWTYGQQITEAEYRAQLDRKRGIDPRKPVDLNKSPPIF